MPGRDLTLAINIMPWREIGIDFRRMGWTAGRVAREMNLPRTTVNQWFLAGSEPNFSDGYRLITLYLRVCESRERGALTQCARELLAC